MEWKTNLRRTQSLKSIQSSCDKPTWTEAGLRNKTTSVSQLVSRYQTTVVVTTSVQETTINGGEEKPKQAMKEISASNLESLMLRNEERERSRAKTNLTRSTSVGSLQNNSGSIGSLKALFESKAATPNNSKSSFRATSFTSTHKAAYSMPVMNGEVGEVKSSAEERKAKTWADPPANETETDGKQHVARKEASQTRAERRKTISGIDFEKLAATQADDKRRSIADFRDSSFYHTKEIPSVSVKAMSALYLSKVAPQESNRGPQQGQEKSSESGKRGKPTKMAEDPEQQRKVFPSSTSSARLQPGPDDFFGAHPQKSIPPNLSKEELYEQRQKCELRRLLKHTHPELKMLDDVVDEELAEVLGSEFGGTADETGYEGEVLSRRMLFENCALSNKVSPYSHKTHMAEKTVERSRVSKTPAVSEEHGGNKSVQGTSEDGEILGSSQEITREEEEEMTRIDVQATRRKFENQSAVNTCMLMPDKKYQCKVSISGDETRQVQKQDQQFKGGSKESQNQSHACTKSKDVEDQIHKISQGFHSPDKSHQCPGIEQISFDENTFEDESINPSDPENIREIIKTSAALFQNNPFIPTNIEREHSFADPLKPERVPEDGAADQGHPIANVKDRTHVFESMPFHQIRHQDQDQIESMTENIKETLDSLYHVNAIHSSGSIIEVNETMLAKKAKFTLTKKGLEIKYDEVAEGGAQNFILQLLPRTNLKPQITYLKERRDGSMKATVVNVPLHHHQQDTEFKTANVVQVVEDILNQDNSLRKGVIFQEDGEKCAEVMVYSLYKYFDKEDVKSYCPPQAVECDNQEPERGEVVRRDDQEAQTGFVESAISCLLATSNDRSYKESTRPEVTVKANVKLFKSCIEKGELEYLKSLQTEPSLGEQDDPSNQNGPGQQTDSHHEKRDDHEEEGTSEWAPVDVQRLKNMFSKDGGPVQPKQNIYLYDHHTKSVCSPSHNDESDAHASKEPKDLAVTRQGSYVNVQTQHGDVVHQAELVEVVDDSDEISGLQAAIHNLKVATLEAKSLHQSSQEIQKVPDQDTFKEPVFSTGVKLSSEGKSEPSYENSETCCKDVPSEGSQTTETYNQGGQESKKMAQQQLVQAAPSNVQSSEVSALQQDDEEVIFQGKLQAALASLGRSNINVTQGDFRAAMIYRSSSKPYKGPPQSEHGELAQKTNKEGILPVTDPAEPMTHMVTKTQVSTENLEPLGQIGTSNEPSSRTNLEKSRKPAGPKPVIPPKPEHLKLKQGECQSTNPKKPEALQTKTITSKETSSQSLAFTSISAKNEHQQYQQEINSGANFGLDSDISLGSENSEKSIIVKQQDAQATAEGKGSQDLPNKGNMGETDESHVDFHEACQKFESKKAITVKCAPVKPKRVKIAQSENKNPKHIHVDTNLTHLVNEPQGKIISSFCSNQTADSKDKHQKKIEQESKVEMREKKGRIETEDERRQRLSVHMDEIMRGNIIAAMEIFDNLRKQEELKSILSRVEEIEQDTSDVDVRSLRRVFENVPDWVVSSDKKKPQKEKVENKKERLMPTRESTESKSSMAHVFGDLERASEEIMNLKEQTLAKLIDIEETIRKALYSVSTLKSDSDIAGLSSLFKESLGTAHPSSGNISKISIESSRTKSQTARERPATMGNTALPVEHSSNVLPSSKHQTSPPSSPAFISIQSAARKTDKKEPPLKDNTMCLACQHNQKTEEKFRTTKTLTCNSPAQNRKKDPRKGGKKGSSQDQRKPNRELSVLDVQTDPREKVL
ncbi:xin actin-binding repeat-containing protein 1-like isoform X1 [Xyrichtys novacula]|uniref:Xin actin-binding repeat-containing protein 1-like isoform X1 n=1 Tax=Xyrichtys novacula TaxID=13765 RepID=A0AAV1H7S3_XYRNO|nr:xin actin-binding repeat-containing protein 1-like isoform X1 [Xyrichtys novacula]